MNSRAFLLLLAVSLSALACGPSRRSSDDDDDDDSSSMKRDGGSGLCECGARECGSPPGCPTNCGTCGAGLTCEDGLCVGTPAACLVDTPCVSNSDCPLGYRCNEAMTPPQCHGLYCAPAGGRCDDAFFCKTGLVCHQSRCAEVPAWNDGYPSSALVSPAEGFHLLYFSSETALCARLGQNRVRRGERVAVVFLSGDLTTGTELRTELHRQTATQSCAREEEEPIEGTFTFTAVDFETGIRGRFVPSDPSLAPADFDAPSCALPDGERPEATCE